MAGFKILVDNSKKDYILKMEGECPCCGHYPSRYIEIEEGNLRQFKYRCPKCESRWQGNLYNNMLEMVE